jgi:hypothetical protein
MIFFKCINNVCIIIFHWNRIIKSMWKESTTAMIAQWRTCNLTSFSPCLTGPVDNVIIPLHLTHLSCPGFTLAAGLPSGFTTTSRQLGGALWRACNLTSFSPCLTSPVDYLFASRHKGPMFKSPGVYLCETGISC